MRKSNDPKPESIIRRHHKGRREHLRRVYRILLMTVLAAVFVVCAVNLIGYGIDYLRAKQASESLRAAYYANAALPQVTMPPVSTPSPRPQATRQYTVQTATPVATSSVLQKVAYPSNPYGIISSRFDRIRRQNADIVGWLTIEGMLDEAVVQRDNSYYLKRDYKGYHNANGAIFLDEDCSLASRPYTLMLYGHNMKTGAMFGNLRYYDDINYYRKNPFMTFDTLYEDGRYVVFASCIISTEAGNWRSISFSDLTGTNRAAREEAIRGLLSCSDYKCAINIRSDDQLLLLITCTGDDTQRRIVAARRVRADETEEELMAGVNRTTKR